MNIRKNASNVETRFITIWTYFFYGVRYHNECCSAKQNKHWFQLTNDCECEQQQQQKTQ